MEEKPLPSPIRKIWKRIHRDNLLMARTLQSRNHLPRNCTQSDHDLSEPYVTKAISKKQIKKSLKDS